MVTAGEEVSDADLVGEPLSRHGLTPLYPLKLPCGVYMPDGESTLPLYPLCPLLLGWGLYNEPQALMP